MSTLTLTAFKPHQYTAFRLALEGEDVSSLDLELIEVTDKTPAGFDGEQFSLVFRGPLDTPLHQRMYTLHHTEMGELVLFLVPIDQRKDGMLYEAFFNRAADTDA